MTHHDAEETVRENVRQLEAIEREARRRDSRQDRIADGITRFSGSMAFVWIHVALFAFWILANLGHVPGVRPWDKYPFELLTMSVSLEAILLATFVLLSQNRQQEIADSRQKLDLHMNLLTEEKATILLQMLCKVSDQLDRDRREGAGDCEAEEEDEPHAFSRPTDLVEIVRLVRSEKAAEHGKRLEAKARGVEGSPSGTPIG